MADIFAVSSMPVPATPVKAGPNVQTTELSPDYSPAPKYTKTIASNDNDQLVGIQTKSKPDVGVSMMPDVDHPVLPIGNVFIDIRNHLSCHSIFNTNVETLLKAYLTMQDDLNQARTNVAKLEREVKNERKEKEAYKHEAEALKRDLDDARADLDQTRSELTITQDKLGLSIRQLMEMSKRLEEVKKQLRDALREVATLRIQLEAKENELQYYKKRVTEVEIALALANKAENDANDRNVRLTQLLYEIEAQKASIERAKDKAEARVRELEDELRAGPGDYKAIIAQLEKQIQHLHEELARTTKQRDQALEDVADRDNKIAELNGDIEDLKLKLAKLEEIRKGYHSLVGKYESVVLKLSTRCPKKCRSKFDNILNRGDYLNDEEQVDLQAYLDANLDTTHHEQSEDEEPITGKPVDPEPQAETKPGVEDMPVQGDAAPTPNNNTEEVKNVTYAE